MTKVLVEKVDGVETAIATIEFNLGEVYREKVVENEDGSTSRTVCAGVHIEGTAEYLKELMKEGTKKDYLDQFDVRLEEYVKLRINQMLGVEKYPLQFNDKNELEGLKDDVEVEILK
jgi:hypothetical protein